MKKLILLLAFLAASASASRGPELTEITSSNAEEYGIELDVGDSGDEGVALFTLRFPAKNGNGCLAGRVQTYVFNDQGEQLTGASFDYDLEEGQAEIMLYHNSPGYEMGVVLQYCCTGRSPRGCREALSIDRLHLFHNKGFNRTPESSGPAKPGELSGGAG